ncbi:hypothetical protein ASD08_47570 [Streptomyces sp. Root369]|nr:hypothetical protein ASD08_47570 [Streptomyces sp. Root369]
MLDQPFVVACMPAGVHYPGQGPFDDPAPGSQDEPGGVLQTEQDFLRRLGVVQVGWGDHHHQGQAAGVDHEMALAAVDLFAWVVTAGVPPDGRCRFD